MTWDKLSARSRRWITVSGIGVCVLFVCWAIATGLPAEDGKTRRAAINEAILTDADTRQTSIDRLAAQLESARAENAELAQKVETLSQEQQSAPASIAQQIERTLEQRHVDQERQLGGRLKELEGALEQVQSRLAEAKANQIKPASTPSPKKAEEEDPAQGPAETPVQEGPVIAAATPAIVFPDAEDRTEAEPPASIFNEPPRPAPIPEPAGQAPSNGPEAPAATGSLEIRFVSKQDAAAADPATKNNQAIPSEGENLFKLPATSILTGTLLTGLDAPTGAQAQAEPLPVLLRLKKEAILPNRFKADVRECFALLGAYGDLSSERAHMRGETMSCVLNDGTILEQPLKAFAVGEDGKEGPRGRLVRREGTFIARALLVGFLEAAANAFDDNQVAVIGGGANLDVQGAQAAAASLGGAATGNALGRIADWYIEQAFQLFPVIEIDAGRQIDVVLTSTFEMNLPAEDD